MTIGPFMCKGVIPPNPTWFPMSHSLKPRASHLIFVTVFLPVDFRVKGSEVGRVTRPVWWICLGGAPGEVTAASGSLCHCPE